MVSRHVKAPPSSKEANREMTHMHTHTHNPTSARSSGQRHQLEPRAGWLTESMTHDQSSKPCIVTAATCQCPSPSRLWQAGSGPVYEQQAARYYYYKRQKGIDGFHITMPSRGSGDMLSGRALHRESDHCHIQRNASVKQFVKKQCHLEVMQVTGTINN